MTTVNVPGAKADTLRLSNGCYNLHFLQHEHPMTQHIAIKNLLICVAVTKINNKKQKLSARLLLETYTECVRDFKSLSHDFYIKPGLMTVKKSKNPVNGKSLLRTYRRGIKIPMLECAKHVLQCKQETKTTSDKGSHTMRLLNQVNKWWLKQSSSQYRCDNMASKTFLFLLPRFCPGLCENLNFGPPCLTETEVKKLQNEVEKTWQSERKTRLQNVNLVRNFHCANLQRQQQILRSKMLRNPQLEDKYAMKIVSKEDEEFAILGEPYDVLIGYTVPHRSCRRERAWHKEIRMRTHMCKILQRQQQLLKEMSEQQRKIPNSNGNRSTIQSIENDIEESQRREYDILAQELPTSESEWEQIISMREDRCMKLQRQQQLLQAKSQRIQRKLKILQRKSSRKPCFTNSHAIDTPETQIEAKQELELKILSLQPPDFGNEDVYQNDFQKLLLSHNQESSKCLPPPKKRMKRHPRKTQPPKITTSKSSECGDKLKSQPQRHLRTTPDKQSQPVGAPTHLSQSQPDVIYNVTAPNVSQPASRAIAPKSSGCSDKLQPQPQQTTPDKQSRPVGAPARLSQSQPDMICIATAPNVSESASRAMTPESSGCSDKLQPQRQSAKDNAPADMPRPQPRTQVRPQPTPKEQPQPSTGPEHNLETVDKVTISTVVGNDTIYNDDESYLDPVNNKRYIPVNIDKGCPGQCLFVAVADQLESLRIGSKHYPEDYYKTLRKKAVETQLKKPYVKGISRTTRSLQNMLQARTYADHHEVCALCEFCNVVIRICQVNNAGKVQWLMEGDKFDQIPKVATDGTTSFVDVPRHRNDRPIVRLLYFFKSPKSSENHFMSLRERKPSVLPKPASKKQPQPNNEATRASQVTPLPVLPIETDPKPAPKPTTAVKGNELPVLPIETDPKPAPKPTTAVKGNELPVLPIETDPKPAPEPSVSEPQPRTQVRPQPALRRLRPETPKTPNFIKFGHVTDEQHDNLMDLVTKIDNAKFRKNMAHDSKFKDKTAECTHNQKTVRSAFYLHPRRTHNHIHICPHARDLPQTHGHSHQVHNHHKHTHRYAH